MSIPSWSTLPHVVIVGGGFAGLHAARQFKDKPVRVTLVDRRNHHLFQPLLYQVATASLSPADIASPIRSILRSEENVRVILGDVTAIDPAAKAIELGAERIEYDYLILAAGAQHSYFGHDEWESVAPGLKSLEDALEIRRRILLAYEAAERTTNEQARNRLLTFVVVGGGPTGVELAGALAEISRYSLARDFDHIDPTEARIYLLEAAPRILLAFPEKLSKKAVGYLQKLGVTVRTETMVTAIDQDGVELAGNERISAGTVLWAAGVKAAPVAASLGVALDRAGRVPVQPDLSIAEHPQIFVAGDLANLAGKDGRPLPGVAQVAMQQGRVAAENALHKIAGEPTEAFHYKDLGNMATVGRNRAIADIGPLKIGGFIAWMAWLFIHILNLIGFRNRAVVMLHWVWSYFTFQRGARLITTTARSQELV
jgi:NADH dehydrogenase